MQIEHREVNGNAKRPYQVPKLRRVPLVAHQTLAYGCKTADPGFLVPNVLQPIGCGTNVPCSIVGT